jgi:hypothetical protein
MASAADVAQRRPIASAGRDGIDVEEIRLAGKMRLDRDAHDAFIARCAAWDISFPEAKGEKLKRIILIAAAARYVDVAVVAPIYPARHQTPLLLAGPHAEAVAPPPLECFLAAARRRRARRRSRAWRARQAGGHHERHGGARAWSTRSPSGPGYRRGLAASRIPRSFSPTTREACCSKALARPWRRAWP